MSRAIMAAAVLWVGIGGARAAEVAPAGAAPLAELCLRLASEDFATRAAAQKQLDLIPREQFAVLQQVAATQVDPEVKARLEARIAAMEVDLAIHPPPVSLDIDGASPRETVAALVQALKVDPQLIQVSRDAGAYTSTAGPFTLHIDQAPFWTVIAKLNEKQTLALDAESPFRFSGSVSKGAYSVAEPFCVQPYISRGQPDGRGLTPVQIQLWSTVDPRIKVARCALEFIDIRAGGGTNLLAAPMFPEGGLMHQSSRFAWSDGTTIQVAPQVKQIAQVKAVLHVIVIVKEERIAIPDVRAQLDTPIPTAQGPLTLTALTETPTSVSFAASTPRALTPENERSVVPIAVHFLGETGGPLVSIAVLQATRVEIPLANKPRSYQAQIVCPAKVVNVDVPVELKDLPIDR